MKTFKKTITAALLIALSFTVVCSARVITWR